MDAIRSYGATPMLNRASMSSPLHRDEPAFVLTRVAGGRFDRYLKRFAEAARAWNHPYLLRFDWEINGSWFPLGARAPGNSPAEFIAAWRHVHDLFTSAGATNASWVWCPNVDFESKLVTLLDLYPGRDYVDWTSWTSTTAGHGGDPTAG